MAGSLDEPIAPHEIPPIRVVVSRVALQVSPLIRLSSRLTRQFGGTQLISELPGVHGRSRSHNPPIIVHSFVSSSLNGLSVRTSRHFAMTSWMRRFASCHVRATTTHNSVVSAGVRETRMTLWSRICLEVHLEVIVGSNCKREAHHRLADLAQRGRPRRSGLFHSGLWVVRPSRLTAGLRFAPCPRSPAGVP